MICVGDVIRESPEDTVVIWLLLRLIYGVKYYFDVVRKNNKPRIPGSNVAGAENFLL